IVDRAAQSLDQRRRERRDRRGARADSGAGAADRCATRGASSRGATARRCDRRLGSVRRRGGALKQRARAPGRPKLGSIRSRDRARYAATEGCTCRGFTLIEVLVALAIVAITLATGIKAAGALTNNAERMVDIS